MYVCDGQYKCGWYYMFVPSINLGHDLTSPLPSLGGLNQIFPAIRFPSPGQPRPGIGSCILRVGWWWARVTVCASVSSRQYYRIPIPCRNLYRQQCLTIPWSALLVTWSCSCVIFVRSLLPLQSLNTQNTHSLLQLPHHKGASMVQVLQQDKH